MNKFFVKLIACASVVALTYAPSTYALANTKDVVLSKEHGTIVRDSRGGCVRTQWEASTDKCSDECPGYDETKTEKKYAVIFFDFDKAEVKQSAYKTIHKLYESIRTDNAHAVIYVHGHTDTRGSHDYNMKLSKRRAESVKHELIKLGIPAEHVETRGHAYDDLLVPTPMNTKEVKNRRAEIYYKVVHVEHHQGHKMYDNKPHHNKHKKAVHTKRKEAIVMNPYAKEEANNS